MPSESERRDRDREVASDHEASERPRGDPADRPDDQNGGHPAERDGSLRQRLANLQAPAAFPSLDLPETTSPSRARKSVLGGLLVGFGASMAVGLLLFGGLKWDDLLAAFRSRPSSSVDLYPPRDIGRRDTGKADRGDEPRKTALAVQTVPDGPKRAATGYIANLNVGVPCDGVLTETRPGILQLQLTDPSRRGSSIIVKIDDLDHRATFGADGRLLLLAPKLFGSATARWSLSDGTPCTKTAPPTEEHSQLRVALVWGGAAALTLHIVEPSAWLGGPAGDISATTPNLGHTRGAGELHTFGQPADPTRVQLYIAEMARLGQTGVLSAVVTLEPSPDGGCSKTGAPATVLRYQLYTLRTDRGVSARPEVRSLAFELPPCDRAAATPRPVERIPIRF